MQLRRQLGKAQGKGNVKIVPWWTEKCSKVILIRNTAKVKKKVKKTYSFSGCNNI